MNGGVSAVSLGVFVRCQPNRAQSGADQKVANGHCEAFCAEAICLKQAENKSEIASLPACCRRALAMTI